MAEIILTLGPPGTGKTTTLAEAGKKAIKVYGDNKNALIIGSLTNAAANEIATRGIPVNRRNIGTLHALCYRRIGSSNPVAETLVHIWNTRVGAEWKMTEQVRRNSSPEFDIGMDAPPSKENKGASCHTAIS